MAFCFPRHARRSALAAGTLASVLGLEGRARALDPEVTSDTALQLYELRSPTGENVIARRRLTTTLGVSGYDLLDRVRDGQGPELTFRARLRYDADYGGDAGETEATNFGRVIPGFSRGPVDLMYGYVEGRRFLSGWLGFKLGRQYVVDSLGWWSFDGGLVRATTPFYLALEAYGGLEQRGGLPLSTPRFEREGIWRGDRTGYDRALWPSFQQSTVAPALGAAIESAGVPWLHGRLTYRRVYNTGASNVSAFESGTRTPVTFEGTRISQERVGYAMDASRAGLGGVKAGLAYDLYVARLSNVYASVDGYLTNRLTLSADYDYFVPTFDADSIWNVFMPMPMNDLGVRASYDATSRLTVAWGARGRAFQVRTTPDAGTLEPMGGGDVQARYRRGAGSVGARGVADVGKTGERVGFDVFGERTIENRYIVSGRAGVWQWSDAQREDRDAVSVGYVAGVGYRLFPRSTAMADFQHDMNRLVGSRYRVMLWLTLAVNK